MKSARVVTIIPAAGQGRRMGTEVPKQYLELAGRPVLWHTLRCFADSPLVDEIVLVLRPEDMDYCRRHILQDSGMEKVCQLVPGGVERADSVLAGLQATAETDDIILVHDAVRPFASEAMLLRLVEAVKESGAAIAAMPVVETVKKIANNHIVETPERAALWNAQTPQGFDRSVLVEAYARRPADLTITDEAMLVESIGHSVRVVQGEHTNIKITTPQDLAWAEWFMQQEDAMPSQQMRVGQGYDVHALTRDRDLVLGGIHIPFEFGLAGHSDADVLTHAIIDALLGASGGGDIGRLFPDSDPQYKGISSMVLLEKVCALLEEKKVRIINIDAVVMAQQPKLAPHIVAMEERIAQVLRVPADVVSLKATTTEHLGFVGRQEGMAAQAVALVEF
jgi:2-C-methyl-D-erythritol 4-phosphate cytidylyltransferase/2-C-methyl-D-erythritol 2,4-cyclodiphosphate synthase